MKLLLALGPSLGIVRVPGVGLVYTELVSGVPAVFSHFVTNIPAFHQIVGFVCIKAVPIPYVFATEQFMVSRIGPKEYRMFSCVVQYGYKDAHKNENDFETQLVLNIAKFIQREISQHRHHPLPMKLEQDINVTTRSILLACGDLVVCPRCESPTCLFVY